MFVAHLNFHFFCNNTQEVNKDEISNDNVENNNLDATTERLSPNNIAKCASSRYDPDFWIQSRRGLANHHAGDNPNWYHNETMSGTYLPNEFDKTCGEKASFGFIVCPKGQNCDAKQGAYPFIAALGT